MPYGHVTHEDVIEMVNSGKRPSSPDNCPEEIYQLMSRCWSHNPDDRPNFTSIYRTLTKYMESCADSSSVITDIKNYEETTVDINLYNN